MTSYVKADRTSQWFGNTFGSTSFVPNCGILHTTEGYDWPGYSGGSMAPNYTGKPNFATKTLAWRVHFEDEESSRALENRPGGVETNTANAIQVELIGTCDPKYASTWGTKKAGVDYIYWPNAPLWALESLAQFIADMNKRHGIKIQGPARGWTAYPESYGPGGQRLTFDEWRNFYGWCGHQHVPENDHGDPGALPWSKIASLASAYVTGIIPTKPVVSAPAKIGTEVAITPKDANAIWGADVIPNPSTDAEQVKANPNWTPASYLLWSYRLLQGIAADVKAIRTKLGA